MSLCGKLERGELRMFCITNFNLSAKLICLLGCVLSDRRQIPGAHEFDILSLTLKMHVPLFTTLPFILSTFVVVFFTYALHLALQLLFFCHLN